MSYPGPNKPLRKVFLGALLSGAAWAFPVFSAAGVATAAEAGDDEPPPFEAICFDDFFNDFGTGKGYTSVDQLKQMLSPVRGRKSTITPPKNPKLPICDVSGLFKLRPQWRADSLFRLSLQAAKGFSKGDYVQLNFWNGHQGIAFRYYPLPNGTWTAYGTTRRGNRPEVESRALWATCRGVRGTVNFHWQDDHLLLSRGDLVLLCVPFISSDSRM